MIRVNEVSLKLDESEDLLLAKVVKQLRIGAADVIDLRIIRKSIDARKREIKFVYTVDVATTKDEQLIREKRATKSDIVPYEYPARGSAALGARPVIVGAGPCGLFAALILAQSGYKPLVVERGSEVDVRVEDVKKFWESRVLDQNSNVQFGEGGAGTFSDGKLTTQIKNPRCRKVLEEFVKFGAPEDVLYKHKPHIGTDLLRSIIVKMRKEIEHLGGTFMFNSKLADLQIEDDQLKAIAVQNTKSNEVWKIPATACVLAVGHSARDTFRMLAETSVKMEQKPFAMGVRIEHKQEWINKAQYGEFQNHPALETADYKLSCKVGEKNVYSFCMCPGGVVVGASSQEGRVVTNGMSFYKRDGDNANSALLVNVAREDFATADALEGVRMQESLESLAFDIAGHNYNAPIQRVEDFLNNITTTKIGSVEPTYKPGVTMVNLREHMSREVGDAIADALVAFGKKIEGFDHKDAIITGFETRSSSPIKITRDANFESNVRGVYPAGEGAGYAGGIMSAAVDGIQVAEKIIGKFLP